MKGMQFQLFDDLPLPPRPSYIDKEVVTVTVEKIAPELIKWMHQSRHFPSQAEIDAIKAEIFSAIEHEDDAYRIAKDLEYAGWDSDGELVDILNNVSRHRYDAHKEIIHQNWVLKHGIVPKFSIGDNVLFTFKNRQETGEIIRVSPETAQYTIHCPQHGHVKKGVGTHGHVINFEECTTV